MRIKKIFYKFKILLKFLRFCLNVSHLSRKQLTNFTDNFKTITFKLGQQQQNLSLGFTSSCTCTDLPKQACGAEDFVPFKIL